jgi:hypothetical protein
MKVLLQLLFLIVVAAACSADVGEVYKDESGIAINGYDPVGYFREGKPVKGVADFELEWNGAVWRFASLQNKADFEKYPEGFAPKYGGYCAYGMSNGYKAPTQPDAWSVVDGKLYLNYNTDVKKDWLSAKDTLIIKADKNWPNVKTIAM